MADRAGHSDAEGAAAPRRRVFFALWPDAATRAALFKATRAAVRDGGGRPTPARNLHVTLAFLGPVTEGMLAELSALGPLPSPAFDLELDRLGYWERAQILWVGPGHVPPPLASLEAALWQRLVALGFARDPRPYFPHVTIARKAQAARGVVRAVTWPVRGFALVESRPGPRSSRYELLASWRFE
jgi:2'-5' RNA ligase